MNEQQARQSTGAHPRLRRARDTEPNPIVASSESAVCYSHGVPPASTVPDDGDTLPGLPSFLALPATTATRAMRAQPRSAVKPPPIPRPAKSTINVEEPTLVRPRRLARGSSQLLPLSLPPASVVPAPRPTYQVRALHPWPALCPVPGNPVIPRSDDVVPELFTMPRSRANWGIRVGTSLLLISLAIGSYLVGMSESSPQGTDAFVAELALPSATAVIPAPTAAIAFDQPSQPVQQVREPALRLASAAPPPTGVARVTSSKTAPGTCARFARGETDADSLQFSLRNECAHPVDCTVRWRVACGNEAARDRVANVFVPNASSESIDASFAQCGDERWTINSVRWRCEQTSLYATRR